MSRCDWLEARNCYQSGVCFVNKRCASSKDPFSDLKKQSEELSGDNVVLVVFYYDAFFINVMMIVNARIRSSQMICAISSTVT